MRRIAQTVAAAVVAAAALTACTSSGDDSSGDESALRSAVRGNVKAINSVDVNRMRAYVSARCRKKQTDKDREDTARLVSQMYGAITLKTITVSDMNAKGTRARVTATTGIDALDRSGGGAWWVREDGSWRNDDC